MKYLHKHNQHDCHKKSGNAIYFLNDFQLRLMHVAPSSEKTKGIYC